MFGKIFIIFIIALFYIVGLACLGLFLFVLNNLIKESLFGLHLFQNGTLYFLENGIFILLLCLILMVSVLMFMLGTFLGIDINNDYKI